VSGTTGQRCKRCPCFSSADVSKTCATQNDLTGARKGHASLQTGLTLKSVSGNLAQEVSFPVSFLFHLATTLIRSKEALQTCVSSGECSSGDGNRRNTCNGAMLTTFTTFATRDRRQQLSLRMRHSLKYDAKEMSYSGFHSNSKGVTTLTTSQTIIL
jgi:hypothetical protein